MKKNETREIAISTENIEKLQTKAKVYNKDAGWLIQQGVEIAANLDTPVFTRLHSQAERLGLPLWRVLENYFIDRWAYESAEVEVQGPVVLLTQFTMNDKNELIVGKELFNLLKDIYVRELKNYDVLKSEKADETLAKHRAELNEYKTPGDTLEERKRKQFKAKYLKLHPGKEDDHDKWRAGQDKVSERRKSSKA